MRLTRCLLLIILLLPAVCVSWLEAAELQTGIAEVDITPPLGYRMAGYFRERLNTGTHDPLRAKALVLRQGEQQAALIFCDLIAITRDVSRRARRQAAEATGIPASDIAIMATHSHTGPCYYGVLRDYFHQQQVAKWGHDPREKVDYPTELVHQTVAAIRQAQQSLRPLKLSVGETQQQGLSFNRRFHMKEGPVRFNPGTLNPNIVRPAGPIDPEVGLLFFSDPASSKAVASLTVFALHLDTVGGTLYSADFPFYLEASLRADFGNQFVSIFGNGTCGDINHINFLSKEPRLKTEVIGNRLAKTVQAKLGSMTELRQPCLGVCSAIVEVPLQTYTADELAWAKGFLTNVTNGKMPFLDRVKACTILDLEARGAKTVGLEVQAFRLGEDVAMVTLPGEVFVDLGLAIKKASPFAQTMVIELANDCPGYIPTRKAFAEGSYETVNSRVQPGGGEVLAETAIRLLKGLKAQIE